MKKVIQPISEKIKSLKNYAPHSFTPFADGKIPGKAGFTSHSHSRFVVPWQMEHPETGCLKTTPQF